ncbi:MAG: GspH/FimT family pseudopilin [Granulosicoccaceae bacterium]
MEKQQKNGFTLIELMIALLVAGILLGVGIPSFSGAISNSRMSGTYNDVAQALYIARSEAVKGSERITVCPRVDGDVHECGDDWSTGILVFVDNDPVLSADPAMLGPEDIVVHSQRKYKKGSTITAHQSTNRSQSSVDPIGWIRYDSTGKTSWGNGFFKLCDDKRGAESSKALNIVATGNLRRGRPVDTSSNTPADVYGRAILCP